MGIRHDVKEGLEKYGITRIEGQPTDEDLNLLTKELTNAAGSVATQNGGGEHGHVGTVVEQAEYITFSRGNAPFVVPTNPGPYPAVVDPDPIIREWQIAKHKAEIVEYETYLGVENYLRRMIVKSVDHEWIAEVKSKTMGFNHLSPMQLLTHLRQVGGSLDHMDVSDKYEQQLLKVGQTRNPELRLAFALATFQASGEYEAPLREWQAKPRADRTFANFCVFMQQEYGKHHKQNKSTAASVGRGIANSITHKPDGQIDHLEAQAILLAEVANSIQETSQKQFKEMMELFIKTLAPKGSPTTTPNADASTKKKKKKCPHCLLEVYHKPEKCFELEANASKRPEGWKSKKTT
eukprot:CCRYP_004047-RB/>CCRYP_004047-RB protein AED:0.40 eAED:0.39 QI:0/0/0/1/0/0/2/0/349